VSQRNSGYDRINGDRYCTPSWVTMALAPHLPKRLRRIWEPACGDGQMARALRDLGRDDLYFAVFASDIKHQTRSPRPIDFLSRQARVPARIDAIITNPPFNQAAAFIERALELMEPRRGFVAMLTRVDYDSAKTRAHLFGRCPQFAKKLTLTRRIVWFDRPGAAPSFNHCWLIWDWRHKGPPVLAHHYENP
jgi:hypothetical protein